jgi:hypothetical protein
MMHFTKVVTVLFLAAGLALVGCASGPKLGDLKEKIPRLTPDRGRVYFYRNALLGFGSAIQSDIKLNGENVGKCEANGVFFIDLPPGDYHVSVASEVERTLNFALEKGEEKFVRCYLKPNFVTTGHLIVELVDPTEARDEMRELAYTGRKLD